jgi:hypothetical protein
MVQYSTKYREKGQLKQAGTGQKQQKTEVFRLQVSKINFYKRRGR